MRQNSPFRGPLLKCITLPLPKIPVYLVKSRAAPFTSAKRKAARILRIHESEELFLAHLENVACGTREEPCMERKLIEAILDYPVRRLSVGLLLRNEPALVIESMQIASPYQSVRHEAEILIRKASADVKP